ncbi:MAG: efflux RND transporter periplasmic adaptor subunit [Myxococcota bacterium]
MDWTSNRVSRQLLRIAVASLALFLAYAIGRWSASPPPPAMHDHGPEDAWTCSMHPQIRSAEAGACPICGMDLVPVSSQGGSTDRVVLSERARKLANLQTTEVRRQSDASAEVRLLGRLEPAETTRRNVTTWVAGRIDRLHVNTTGERVRRNQVIAKLYSPEVYSAHQDLLTARTQVDRFGEGTERASDAARAALSAARERLRLLGVPEDEVERMATATEPTRSVSIRSPFGGTVIERAATEGAYVETGATLYRIADLGQLWVQLDAYESDLPRLATGQSVELVVEALPGERFEGRVGFIEPTIDAQRRTARVRVEVDNASGRLRPGMFAEALVSTGSPGADAPLVVPHTAPLFTGRRSVVYVEVPTSTGPAFEPRTVRLGPRLGDVYPVVSGLSRGERVVSRGAFALDADLQIRGGHSMMSTPDDTTEGPEPTTLTPGQRRTLAPVLRRYLDVQRGLAEDDHAKAVRSARALQTALDAVALPASSEDVWTPLAEHLDAHANHVAGSADIEGARAGFEPLSAAIEHLLTTFGNPIDEPVHVAFCSMAKGNQGARWVQTGKTIDNAYFGATMRTCGELRAAVVPNGYLTESRP